MNPKNLKIHQKQSGLIFRKNSDGENKNWGKLIYLAYGPCIFRKENVQLRIKRRNFVSLSARKINKNDSRSKNAGFLETSASTFYGGTSGFMNASERARLHKIAKQANMCRDLRARQKFDRFDTG